MLDEKHLNRLTKNILDSFAKNDIRVLTIPTCRWIIANYWLRPDGWFSLLDDYRRQSKKDFEPFYNGYSLLEHFIDEVDLNYGLTWILHWIKLKQGTHENVKSALENFKQRCVIVQTIRDRIGLKVYSIHYEYNNGWNGKTKRYVIQQRGRSMNEALHLFLERWKSRDKFSFFKVNSIRKVSDRTFYFIQKDERMSPDVFTFLTTDNGSVYTGAPLW